MCIFDIKPEDRYCEYCSAYCEDRPQYSVSTTSQWSDETLESKAKPATGAASTEK